LGSFLYAGIKENLDTGAWRMAQGGASGCDVSEREANSDRVENWYEEV
jgi:hypothetical protein